MEAIEPKCRMMGFVLESEELWSVITNLPDCLDNSSPPLGFLIGTYVVPIGSTGNFPVVCLVVIGDTPKTVLSKRVLRAERNQLKVACGNLHICASLGAVILGSTHVVI